MFFNMTGGDANFSFKIIKYGTKEEMIDSTPPNNTIGVVTSTEISSWAFSAEEPIAPVNGMDGMLWITTGKASSGAFNALRKNNFQIYPLYAKQYIGGMWTDVEAMNYLDGFWVTWASDIVLYDNGSPDGISFECNSATVNNNGYINLSIGTNTNTSKVYAKSEPIILGGQALLKIDYSNFTGTETFAGLIYPKVWNTDGSTALIADKGTGWKNDTSGSLELDISSLNGKYCVGVCASNSSSSNGGSCRIKSIKVLMGEDVATLSAKAEAYDILTGGITT